MAHVFNYDRDTKVITIPAPDVTVRLQALYNDIRDFEDNLLNLDDLHIVDAAGKLQVDAGPPAVLEAISLKLVNGWRLAFEARGGPGVTLCTVTGGVITAWEGEAGASVQQYPIVATALTSVSIAQAASGTFIQADDLERLRKHVTNRNEITGFGGTVTQTVYDDDGTTPLESATLTTDGGEGVTTNTGVQTKRTAFS